MSLVNHLEQAIINFAGTGDNTVIAAVAGKAIEVYGLFLTKSAGAETMTFKDGTAISLTGAMSLAAGQPLILPHQPDQVQVWFRTSFGNAFIINKSAAVEQVSGRIYFRYRP